MSDEERQKRWKLRAVRLWRGWIRPIAAVLIVLGSFRSAVADWNDVPTGSMNPTILEGDRIFVNKLAYGLRFPFTDWWLTHWDGPDRGDVVICYAPDSGVRLVKRIVGLPGDVLEMRNNRLLINGSPVEYGALDREPDGWDTPKKTSLVLAEEHLGACAHPVVLHPRMPAQRSFRPTIVPEGRYFVMGDNRDNSRDSRAFGFVEREQIVGKATAVVWSLDRDSHYLPRWSRFFESLP